MSRTDAVLVDDAGRITDYYGPQLAEGLPPVVLEGLVRRRLVALGSDVPVRRPDGAPEQGCASEGATTRPGALRQHRPRGRLSRGVPRAARRAVARMSAVKPSILGYLRRGWQPIQLHGLRPDGRTCTCRKGATCPGPGKHPVDTGWQQQHLDLAALLEQYAARPWASNVGLLTGAPSGLFVLDVDPDNGGDLTLAALLEQHGALPDTHLVRTGSGGQHFYWQIPPVAQRNTAGRLGAGLDIRADGGQVVAPPSVSGKGGYTVAQDMPPAEPPAWLVALLTAPPAPKRPAPPPCGNAVGRVAALLNVVHTAPEGSRNGRVFWAACRLGEMAAAGAVDPEAAARALYDVGTAVGLADTELVGFDGRGGTIWSGLNRGMALTA